MIIVILAISAFLCYTLQFYIYRRYWNHNLSVTLSFSGKQAVEGDRMILTEILENRKPLPLFMVKVKFHLSRYLDFLTTENSNISDHYYRCDVLSVMAYQKITRELPFLCSHRGYFTILGMDALSSDLFLTANFIQTHKLNLYLYVYPKYCECPDLELAFRQMLGDILTRRCLAEDPFEFRGIREYQSFDSMKAVNWKSTAKSNELKVNMHDYTSTKSVSLYLNLEDEFSVGNKSLKEQGIRIAATLADRFIREGIPVSFASNGCDLIKKNPIVLPAGSGLSHIHNINEGLSRIDLSQTIPSFCALYEQKLMETTETDYIVLISTHKHKALIELILDTVHRNENLKWICPLELNMELKIPDELKSHIIRIDYDT